MSEESVKMSGAQFKRFYTDPELFGDNWYFEEEDFVIDQESDPDELNRLYGDTFDRLPDTAVVRVLGGFIAWQGRGKEPVRSDGQDLMEAAERWLAQQPEEGLVVTVRLPVGAVPQKEEYVIVPRRSIAGTPAETEAWAITGLPVPKPRAPGL